MRLEGNRHLTPKHETLVRVQPRHCGISIPFSPSFSFIFGSGLYFDLLYSSATMLENQKYLVKVRCEQCLIMVWKTSCLADEIHNNIHFITNSFANNFHIAVSPDMYVTRLENPTHPKVMLWGYPLHSSPMQLPPDQTSACDEL